MIEPGIYKLRKRIENPSPSGNTWTSCAHIPPADGEWDGEEAIAPKDFLLVVRDVEFKGRSYRVVEYGLTGWASGFFIGETPKRLSLGLSFEELELHEEEFPFRNFAEEAAPEAFLNALVPVCGETLEEILLLYGHGPNHNFVDPGLRLQSPSAKANTVYEIFQRMTQKNPELLRTFEEELHVLLIEAAVRLDTCYGGKERFAENQRQALEQLRPLQRERQ